MPEYVLSSEEEENWRLEALSKIFAVFMDGKKLLAPVDLARSGLKVLDSAASNGYWLTAFRPFLSDPDSCTLIGTDIQDRFPDPQPKGITLQTQDINKPWPAEWKGTFDFVHQTLVLVMAGQKQREAIHALLDLVKPGGWVELIEPENSCADDDGPAQQQWVAMLKELFQMQGSDPKFALGIEEHVRAAGFVDVVSKSLPTSTGKKLPADAEMQELSVKANLVSAKGMLKAGKMIPGGFKCISPEDLDTWLDRWEKELRSQGGVYSMRVVYARKPEAS